MKKKYLIAIASWWVNVCLLQAQDARFSQITAAPMQLNPALCGRFDGNLRASSLFSWQKSNDAYVQHQYLAADGFLDDIKNFGADKSQDSSNVVNKKNASGNWAVGLSYYRYGTDLFGFYQNTSPLTGKFISATLAKHYYRNNITFGVGGQLTYAEGNLNESGASKLEPEIIGGGFRYSTANTGTRTGTKKYLDAAFGGYFGMKSEQFSFEVGGSVYHLTSPKNNVYDYNDDESRLRRRIVFYAVNRFNLSNKWALIQKNIYWSEGLYWRSNAQNDSSKQMTLWTGFEFQKRQPSSNYYVNFGLYARSFTTLMPYAHAFLGKSLEARYSFEFPINIEQYKSYTAVRTELSVIYTFKKASVKKGSFSQFNYW